MRRRVFAIFLALMLPVISIAGNFASPASAQFNGCLRGFCNGADSPAFGWVLPGASIDMDFAHGRYWGGAPASLLTVARAQTVPSYAATLAGTLTAFAADTPRITDQGLLVEEARTNLVVQSNSPSAWASTNGTPTITAAATIAPDLTLTGVRVARVVNTATYVGPLLPGASVSAPVSFSVYLKKGAVGNFAALRMSGGSPFTAQANFSVNLTTGALTANVSSAMTVASSSVVASNNGWWKVGITLNTDASGANVFLVSPTDAAGQLIDTTVTNANNDIYVAFMQVENGAFPTSYIPTTTASATRAADVPQLIGPALTAALNAKAAFFQTTSGVYNVGNRLLDFSGPLLGYVSATLLAVNNGTINTSAIIGGAGTIAGTIKSAYGFDATSMTVLGNGGAKSSLAGAWGAQVGPVILGNRGAGDRALSGYMQRFALSLTKGAFDTLTAP